MKWKKRPSEILLLILTFILPVAIGNHQSGGVRRVSEDRQNGGYDVINDKNANNNNKNVRSLVPGHQTAMLQNGHVIHLDHLRLLDPYNLIASMKENGNKLDPFLAELLPEKVKLGKNKRKHPNNIEGSRTDYGEDVNSLSPESTNDSNDNSSSVNATDDGLNSSTRSKEDSYFEESDFDLYDDYDDVGIMTSSDDGDFNRNTKVAGRRRKKGNSRNSEGHNALLHEAVRKLLGFSRSHSWGQKKSRFLPDPYGQEKIPRYVKDLYERFQSGEMNAGLAQGNTIRSIHASVGDVEGESMFLFNLSSLRSSERLLNAEIHLYKRRFRPKGLHKLDIQVKLYRVAPHYLSEVGRITMRDDVSHGWLWYDVTNAVQDCVTPRRRHADLFALSFRVKKPNGKVKSVSLRKFGRHHSMPFLVLYSNETEEVSFEQIDILTDRLWSKEKGKHGGVDSTISKDGDPSHPERSSDSGENESTRENVQLDKELTRTFQPGDFTTGVETSKSRTKRSIYDNEIPENPEINFQDYEFVNTIPQTHPRVLKPRKESHRNNLKSYSSFLPLPHQYGNNNNNINIDNNRNTNYNDNDDDDNDDDDKKKKKKKTSKNNNNKNKTSDNDSSIKRRRRKKTHRHKKFNHKQHQHHNRKTRLPFPKAWDAFSTTGYANFYNNNNNNNNNNKNNNNKYYNYHDGINNINNNNNKNNNFFRGGQSVTSGSSSDSSGGVCGRRRLTVDFADIGWGDWIISPKSFEAHYCSGTCPFPLNKGLHPSNHATIQSIVHAIGIHSNVPAPCCVPDKMSSVTLLYFDEDRNVVLKNYPGMTVESCACR